MRRVIALLLVVTTVFLAAPVFAHEHRNVSGFDFSVGWDVEPAYAGFLNAVAVTVTDAAGKPVTDIPADALKVEVSSGSDKTTVSLAPAFRVGVFGDPGHYTAPLIPTRAGAYAWRFTGTIHGTKIDASFTSSETTFDSPGDPSAIQFPDKAPSARELSDRIEREVPRLEQANATLVASLRKTKDDLDNAKLFGYLGVGVGAVAFLLAAAGLARKRG